MKKLLLTSILFFVSTLISFSQVVTGLDSLKAYYLLPVQNVITYSKSEQEARKPGKVLRIQRDYLGSISTQNQITLSSEAYKATFLPNSETYKWISLSFSESAFFGQRKISASLDGDELNEMISSLSIIRDSVYARNPLNIIEYKYTSQLENVTVGAYTDGADLNNRWSCYIKLNEAQLSSYYVYPKITFDRANLKTFIEYLISAKKFLDEQ